MTAPARFRQTDITRAMAGARRAGFTAVRVEIDLQGNIVIVANDDSAPAVQGRRNPLDRLLVNRE